MNSPYSKYSTMRRLVHISILLLIFSTGAMAQARYWVASGATADWSNAANWSVTSGGAGGAGVPATNNIAVFDNGGTANCNLDIPAITILALTVTNGYTGTVSPTSATSMTIRFDVNLAGGNIILPAVSSVGGIFTQNNGTFTLGATSSSFANNVFLNNGTFNANGTAAFLKNLSISATASFSPGTSTVVFEGTDYSVLENSGSGAGMTTFYNLSLNKTDAVRQNLALGNNDQVIVLNDLTLTDGALVGPSITLSVGRNLFIGAAFSGAQVNLLVNGNENSTITVNAPFTTTLSGTTTINKATAASQVSFVTDLPSNLINFNLLSNNTINFTQGTINFPDNDESVWSYNNFVIGANTTFSASTNLMTIQGNFTNSGTFAGNGGTVAFNSAQNRSYAFGTAAENGTTTFSNVILNNTNADGSFNIQVGDRFAVENNLTIVDGYFNSIGGSLSNQSFLSVGGDLILQADAKAFPLGIHLEFIGSNPQTVSLASGANSFFNGNVSLLKTAPGPITLNSPVVLDVNNQTITFTGGVLATSTANPLSLVGNTVTVAGGSAASYVDGPVLRTGNSAFTYPVGGDGFYAPVHLSGTINYTSNLGATSTYSVQYIRQNPDPLFDIDLQWENNPENLKISECEYWIIDQQNTPPVAAPIVWLSYDDTRSCGLTQPSTVGVTAWVSNQNYWRLYGNGAGFVTENGVNFLGAGGTNFFVTTIANPVFTLSTINEVANPLPVTWLDFTGRYVNGSVELNWSTSMELNNEEYTIERSADGQNFNAIGTLAGVGNTTNISRYNFKDSKPLAGSGYYRIKQTDRDGKFSYSTVIRVSNSDVVLKGLRIYPNPISGKSALTLENGNWTNKKVTITIYNAVGGVVRQEQITFGTDSRAKINVNALQKGSYFITTSSGSEKQTLQFFIQ